MGALPVSPGLSESRAWLILHSIRIRPTATTPRLTATTLPRVASPPASTTPSAAVGALARLFHAQTGEKVSAGTANAQTLTTGLGWAALESAWVAFTAGSGLNNTGAATLNVDSLGTRDLKLPAGGDLYAGAIREGGVYMVAYKASVDDWILLNPSPGKDRFYGVFRGTVADGDTTIVLKASRALTITETTTKCISGTATATFKINTTALGGTANSVSSTEQSQAHSTTNSVAAGDDIVITISSASTCIGMSWSIEFEEPAA